MNTAKFNTILAALQHLTDQQIRRVERVLKGESPEKGLSDNRLSYEIILKT